MADIDDDRPALVQPRRVDNPFAEVGQPRANGAMVAVEQQRAIAEVQAKLVVAQGNRRDPIRAVEQITNDCCRPTLAEAATFSYSRGGTDIHAPSIRLAEVFAQRWGNIESGVQELARHDGYSECLAYAWDLETNFTDKRQFQVRHWRDTKGGGYRLTDERDIYELIANMGARRKRAAILAVIPGDVVEAALEQCERTMQARADTSPEGIKKLVEAFAEFAVTAAQIETRIQRRLDAIRPAQVVGLRKIYNSLRDGMSEPADWFDRPPLADPPATATAAAPGPAAAPPRRRGRPRNDERAPEPVDNPSPGPTPPQSSGAGIPPAEPVDGGSQRVDPAAAARRLQFD